MFSRHSSVVTSVPSPSTSTEPPSNTMSTPTASTASAAQTLRLISTSWLQWVEKTERKCKPLLR